MLVDCWWTNSIKRYQCIYVARNCIWMEIEWLELNENAGILLWEWMCLIVNDNFFFQCVRAFTLFFSNSMVQIQIKLEYPIPEKVNSIRILRLAHCLFGTRNYSVLFDFIHSQATSRMKAKNHKPRSNKNRPKGIYYLTAVVVQLVCAKCTVLYTQSNRMP